MATRSVDVTLLTLVQRADPDWRRDWLLQPELEPDGLPASRAAVKQNWQNRGPYESE